ncbi:hypothetical protein [Sphingomonas sp. dw_22]|uniref:hypothetical protein n=1 Tax=Sphingomonas sp. dw_22 TaxID=2721175 RepID=UPI001BD2996A|nr:hypothetical protein [Sphingomonas sp. dw_22]
MAGSKGRGRWSAAAREAFLASLSGQGHVRHACAAVGMTVASVYQLRGRDAGFASAWDAALDRARAARAARQSALILRNPALPGHRIRRDGWTGARLGIFLRALAETGCVRDACKRAAISSTSAYRLRMARPDFARAWQRALDKAAPTIEQAAFTRAVEGWDEVVTRDGRELSRRRRYSDSLLRLLLQRGDLTDRGTRMREQEDAPSRVGWVRHRGGVEVRRIATEEETNAALMKKLAVLERQLREEQAQEAAAQREEGSAHWKAEWERWKAGGSAPDAPAPDGPQLRLIGPK